MQNITSYLKKLNFDPKLLNSLHAKYMVRIRLVLLLVFTIVALGVSSLLILPRRLNPEIRLAIVTVSTVLPGAGPQEVESLVTVPLEDKLSGLSGLDTITSVSNDNFSMIVMQFLSGVDKDKARSDAQTAVSEVTTLPTDAQIPKVTALDFENSPIWVFTLTSKSDLPSLMRFANTLKDQIKRLPNVSDVVLSGFDTQEIEVRLDPEKIRNLGINPLALSAAIKAETKALPAGSVYTDAANFSLAIDSQVSSVDDVRNIQLVIGGQPVALGEIAQVLQRSKPNQNKTYIASGNLDVQPGVTFSVFKTSNADIDKTVKTVEDFVNKTININDGNFRVTSVLNTGELISKQFTDLVGEFQSTILLVFINLLLFLGIRQALIASITIPLTFLMSFAWMNIFGQTINFLTLFALLLAFGTSIDDTIVTVSAMTTYYRTKKFTPHETGILVWRDFVVPIWTTTVTTVWAFLPLILTSGIIGEFIKPIPLVVATTMYTSTFVAWFITLPFLIVLLKPQIPRRVSLLGKIIGVLASLVLIKILSPNNLLILPIAVLYFLLIFVFLKTKDQLLNSNPKIVSFHKFLSNLVSTGIINTTQLGNKYRQTILKVLSSKRGRRVAIIGLLSFSLFSYTLLPLGLVKYEFFPKSNGDTVYVILDMPSGTNLETLDRESKNILEDLRQSPETIAVTAETGSTFNSGFGSPASPNSTLFTMVLVPEAKRHLTSDDIATRVRTKYEKYAKGKISVQEISGGPPAGADVQIEFLGDDLAILNDLANKTVSYLSSRRGLINVQKSVKEGTSKLAFVPDKTKMSQAGLTPDSVGLWLRLSASGFTLDTVRFGNKDQDVVFYTNNGTLTPEDLGRISIPTPTGDNIPLLSLGSVRLENNPTVITRESGKRTISVTAGVLPGFSASGANSNLEKFANTELKLPDGYTWKTGGVNEENQKSVTSLIQAMGLSFILIMATMVVEFNSFRQAAMILALIPFAISGVFIIFGLSGTALSFPALIGVMALFGVVVTNAMFIVEKINQNIKGGMELKEAIADAAESRLEPIMLTSLTSILGLVPITLANPLWRGLGGAIIAGLLFSGAIMLIFIPVTYYLLFRKGKTPQTSY